VVAARILKSLGMADTAFYVPAEKAARIVQPKMEPFFDPTKKRSRKAGRASSQRSRTTCGSR
jgi:hypothetical protein